jgi:hypothetical protein
MNPMKSWRLVGVISLVLAFASSCSSPPVLPDRAAPVVKAEETRLAALLSADRSALGVPGVCTVRLLGQKAGASFVMADCKARDSSYSTYGPKRVEGSKVTKPGDGAAFPDTVREMFPEDLADFVLNNQDSPELRP